MIESSMCLIMWLVTTVFYTLVTLVRGKKKGNVST